MGFMRTWMFREGKRKTMKKDVVTVVTVEIDFENSSKFHTFYHYHLLVRANSKKMVQKN